MVPPGAGSPVSGQAGGGAVEVVVVGFGLGGAASLCAGEEHALSNSPARAIAPNTPQTSGRRARARWGAVVAISVQ